MGRVVGDVLEDHSAVKSKALRSVETSAAIRLTRRHIPQDTNVERRHCEDVKSQDNTKMNRRGKVHMKVGLVRCC